MPTKPRRLSAIFVGVVAVASLTASPALATVTHDFEAEKYPYIVTGSVVKPPVFKFSGGAEVTCTASALNGTITERSSPLTVEPTFGSCILGTLAATLDTGCTTLFTGLTTASEHAAVHIECPLDTTARITVNGCTIEIGPQTPEGGARYTNTGSKVENPSTRDVDINVTMQSVSYVKTGALCPLISGLTGELSITGTYTVKAYADEGKKEGAQIGFWTEATIS